MTIPPKYIAITVVKWKVDSASIRSDCGFCKYQANVHGSCKCTTCPALEVCTYISSNAGDCVTVSSVTDEFRSRLIVFLELWLKTGERPDTKWIYEYRNITK